MVLFVSGLEGGEIRFGGARPCTEDDTIGASPVLPPAEAKGPVSAASFCTFASRAGGNAGAGPTWIASPDRSR